MQCAAIVHQTSEIAVESLRDTKHHVAVEEEADAALDKRLTRIDRLEIEAEKGLLPL